MPPWLPNRILCKSRQIWAWLGMTGHTLPKVVVWDEYPWWISPYKKTSISMNSFQIYWWSKDPVVSLDESNLAHKLWSRIFPDINLHRETGNCKVFHSMLLTAKHNDKILGKFKKATFLALFVHFRQIWCVARFGTICTI